jgi:hypothetical protein
MKESKLIEMQNKIESLSRIAQFILGEIENTKTMAVGTYQVMKEMPGYDEAMKVVTERVKPPDEETEE